MRTISLFIPYAIQPFTNNRILRPGVSDARAQHQQAVKVRREYAFNLKQQYGNDIPKEDLNHLRMLDSNISFMGQAFNEHISRKSMKVLLG